MSKTFLQLVIPKIDSELQAPPCTKRDPELFFPVSYQGGYEQQIKEAKAVCRSCPIATRIACLEFALETGDQHAILGETTPGERYVIRSKRIARAERDRQHAAESEAEFAKYRRSWTGTAA